MTGAIVGVAFLLASLLTKYLCGPRSLIRILDHPNERSLHERPVPRVGGIAIIFASCISLTWFAVMQDMPAPVAWIGIGVGLVAFVSYWDDRSGLSVGARLLAHVVAFTLLLVGDLSFAHVELPGAVLVLPQPLAVGIALLFTVWMTNLFNFMDGMDGFAAGMAVIGFTTYALFGWQAGHESFLAVNCVVAAASAGFLVHNFPPARIFMGDVGSSTLGFAAAAMSFWGAKDGVFPHWVAVLVFAPFVADATVTIFRRVLGGERIWRAHRSHYYQRLVRLGWGHRKTVLWEYALMLACAASALWAQRLPPVGQWALIACWVAIYAGLAMFVSRLEHKSSGRAGSQGPKTPKNSANIRSERSRYRSR